MAGLPYQIYSGRLRQPLNPVDVLPPELRVQLDSLVPQADPINNAVVEPNRYSNFNNQAILVGLASTLVLRAPSGRRVFLFVVNTHAVQTLFIRFGANVDAIIGVPIQPLFGFIGFDIVVPQDDVYLVGNGAGTTGVLLYSNV